MSIPQGWVANSRRLREHRIQTPALQHGSRLGGLTWPRSQSQCLPGQGHRANVWREQQGRPGVRLMPLLARSLRHFLSLTLFPLLARQPPGQLVCGASSPALGHLSLPCKPASASHCPSRVTGLLWPLAPTPRASSNLETQISVHRERRRRLEKVPKTLYWRVSASIPRREEPGAPS